MTGLSTLAGTELGREGSATRDSPESYLCSPRRTTRRGRRILVEIASIPNPNAFTSRMRLLVSNPDTLGDLVLRQPMYRALLDAGHELTLVVRPAVAPLVRHVAPGARVLELPYEAYASDIADRWDQFRDLFDTARAANPDALVIAPYR